MYFSNKILLYITALISTMAFSLKGQLYNLGQPEIINYTKQSYGGGTQSWAITSGYGNALLIANNDGLLIFDGHNWRKNYLPNRTIARSVWYDESDDKIYTGGQDEVGYFIPEHPNGITYQSIKESIPVQHNILEDVWDMVKVDRMLYFRSLHRIFQFDGKNWQIFAARNITSLSTIDYGVIYNDLDTGLYLIDTLRRKFVEGSNIFRKIPIIKVIDFGKDDWVVFTEKDGIYTLKNSKWSRLETKESRFLRDNRVHAVCKLANGHIAVGTHLGGILLLDKELRTVSIMDKKRGLQNNTVSALYQDHNGNLWAGTYNGVDYIKLNNDFTTIIPDGNLSGAVYDVAFFNNRLYCGTENGLYYKDLKNNENPLIENSFKLVAGSEGQVWGLDTILGNLIMNHNEGAFVVLDNKVQKISTAAGAWKFIEWEGKNIALGGFYDGIYLFEKIGNNIQEIAKLTGFYESSRIMVKDGTYLWVSHPYRGLFRLSVNIPDRKIEAVRYDTSKGLPTNYRNHIFRLRDQIIVAAERGVFKFDHEANYFERIMTFDQQFGKDVNFRKLVLLDNTLWYVNEKECGYVKLSDNILSLEYQPNSLQGLSQLLVAGFENLYPLQNGEALFMTVKGIKYYHPRQIVKRNLKAYISKVVSVKNGETVYDAFSKASKTKLKGKEVPEEYKSRDNAFTFYFANTDPGEFVSYRYILQSLENEWSEWSNKDYKEYNNLPHGKHILKVQTMDGQGNVSPESEYVFFILAPWYLTNWAKSIYFLVVVFLIWSSRRRLVRKFERKTNILQSEMKKSEEKVLQLQNEKLEAEVNYKNKELGLTTMHLLQKNETLGKLRNELSRIKKGIQDKNIRQELNNVISILNDDERLEDDWEQFAINFDLVHNDFLKKIKQKYPSLTPKDLKLCAYLRMNLSSKDVAPLLNISVRGVEISRYRLRKKLDIPNEVNLNDFMMSI